jgi:hypothetical protein
MVQRFEQPQLRSDLIDELRQLALRGAAAKDMIDLIHARLGFRETAIIPVLAYITRAFGVSLREALPLRELIGTDLENEMDAILLPAIERFREQCRPSNGDL